MKVKIVENEKYPMTDDFKRWIEKHKDEVFTVKEKIKCNDETPGYILYKIPFRVNKHFTIEINTPIV